MTLAMKRKWANKSHLPEGWGLVWCQAFLLLLLLHSLPYSTGFHTPPHNPLPPHLCTSLQALHSMTVHFILFNTSHNLYSFCNKVPGGVADWVKGETGLKLSSPSPLLTLTQLCPCHLSPPPPSPPPPPELACSPPIWPTSSASYVRYYWGGLCCQLFSPIIATFERGMWAS